MICNQLEAGLEPSLRAECSREDLCAVTDLKDWIERVKKIEEWLTFDRKRYRDIFLEETVLRASKRPALGNSRIPNAPTSY
jgi:predicted S18 family serine protease